MLLGSLTTPYFGALNPDKPLPKPRELATHAAKIEGKWNDKINITQQKKQPRFIQNTTLAEALKWSPEETFAHLSKLVSPEDFKAIQKNERVPSPLKRANVQNSEWLKSVKMVGVNPRAVGTYFNILKTAMIYPERAIHILPIYTTKSELTRSKRSLFSPMGWTLSDEFLDPYLTQKGLKTATQQLSFVTSALHAMGRVVGVDVLSHMSSYSYESFAHPEMFEWIHLDKQNNSQLYPKGTEYEALSSWHKDKIRTAYLRSKSPENVLTTSFIKFKKEYAASRESQNDLFDLFEHHINRTFTYAPQEAKKCEQVFHSLFKKTFTQLSPSEKEVLHRVYEATHLSDLNESDTKRYFNCNLAILKDSPVSAVKKAIIQFLKTDANNHNLDHFFSLPLARREEILWGDNEESKVTRHLSLTAFLHTRGLRAVPLSEGSTLRPILFDRVRSSGSQQALFEKPNMAQGLASKNEFFVGLTPYSFFPVKQNGYLDINHPNWPVFDYFAKQASTLAKSLNLDFIRADLAHSQVSHATDEPVEHPPEFWAHLKKTVQKHTPYFGVFGESLLIGGRSVNIIDDLNHKKVDSIVGNTDYIPVDSAFIHTIQSKSLETGRHFKEVFPVVTHDSDVKHYRDQNAPPLALVTRYFMHLFQSNPGYTMSGFETNPGSLAHKYLFKQANKFDWGNDLKSFEAIHTLRQKYEKLQPDKFAKVKQEWLTSNTAGVGAWTIEPTGDITKNLHLFISNTDLNATKKSIVLNTSPSLSKTNLPQKLRCTLSTTQSKSNIPALKVDTANHSIYVDPLSPGENRIYKFVSQGNKKD